MKKYVLTVLFSVFLLAGNLFAITGELIVRSIYGTQPKLRITVNTSSYAWKWNENTQQVIPETRTFPVVYEGNSYNFDAPKSVNSNTDYLPWGLMHFTVSTLDANGKAVTTINFTIDLRDEDWAASESKYPSHDTYVERDNNVGKWYIYGGGKKSELKDGNLVHIWLFWNYDSDPNTTNLKVPITLMNRTEGGNYDFGYLIANGNEQVNSGQNGNFGYNLQSTVSHGTTEETSSGRKYSFKWDPIRVTPVSTQNIYNSTLNFTIPENNYGKNITRYFRKVYPLTVKNDLEGLSTSTGSIFFKDPTTTNILEEKPASGAGFIKNEAFANLDEYINSIPQQKYALKAQNIIQYGGLEYLWYGGDFNPSTPTDIMVSDITTKTAHYKAHLRSSIQTATGSNGSQRKIAKDCYGTLHMVYESVGKIWYTTSTDGGVTWSFEQPISGSGTSSSPSIAASGGTDLNDIFFVWQETQGSTRSLYVKSLVNCPTPVLLDSDASTVDLQPSVAVSSDEAGVLITYKKMYIGRYQLHYKYSNNWGGSFSYGGPVSLSTPVTWNNPSTAWNPQMNSFMVSLTNTSGAVQVYLLSFDGTQWSYLGNAYSSSQIPMAPVYSQVAVDGIGRTHISWIAYDDYYGNNSASFHRSYKDGVFSGISTFRDEAIYEPSIVYTTISGHSDALDGGVSLFYSPEGQIGLYNMVSTNGTSWNGITYITPSAPIKYPTSLEKAPAGSVTYVTAKGSAMPYQVTMQTVDNTRASLSYTLKSSSENVAVSSGMGNTKVFRRIELIDTTSGSNSRLVVQMGNFQGGGLSFHKTDSLKKKENPFSSFMSTRAFLFGKDASVSTDLWVKKSGWKNDLKLMIELVEEGSEKVLQKVYEGNLSLKESMAEEKTFKITNRFTATKAYLRVSVDGIAKENLIVNDMDYYLLSSGHDKVQKPEREIVESEIAPVEYALSQNFPNPFNPSTVINYQIPKASKVTLKVYDMLGKEVATLVDGYKEMGSYSVQFNASSLPSGTYIYEIRANDFVKSGKMLLLK